MLPTKYSLSFNVAFVITQTLACLPKITIDNHKSGFIYVSTFILHLFTL